MELIDRKRLRYIWGYADHGDYLVVLGHEIMDAPVIDAVPVVYGHIRKKKERNCILFCLWC